MLIKKDTLIKQESLNGKVGLNNVKNKVIKYEPEIDNQYQEFENEATKMCESVHAKDILEKNKTQMYKENLVQERVKEHGSGGKVEEASQDHSYNPTCLLNADLVKPEICILKSLHGSYPDITIEHYPFFIGKFRNNVDYCIDKDVISRYHAKVTREGEEYFLTDLNSTNGTYLNGEMLLTYQKKEVKFADEITFADLKYQFLKA